MTIKKHFAIDGGDLDASMDELVEVLAQMLDEPTSAENQGTTPAIVDLHSPNDRVIHVIEPKEMTMKTELQSWP